jgi:hypothetical protein
VTNNQLQICYINSSDEIRRRFRQSDEKTRGKEKETAQTRIFFIENQLISAIKNAPVKN